MTKPTIEQLRAEVRAPILTSSDPGYDEARAVHNGMFDKRPQVIVRAEQAADVIGAVNFAREAGLDLSIKGGGHSAPGFGTNDGGVVIDLSLMRYVHVDPATRTARTGGGATWGDFNYATHAYGLATTGGIISTTGVAGLTLGGGIGHLARGYGLSLDNLLSAEVVTADGQVRTASSRQNEDLFWALRGGGGNFGVVTSFEFRLHPVKDVYVGLFFYETRPGRQPAALLPGLHQRRPGGVRLFPGLPDCPASAVHPGGPARRHVLSRRGPLGRSPRSGRASHEAVPGPGPSGGRNGRADALPGLELRLRRPLPEGDPGLLEGQLRDRADRRRHRSPPGPRTQGARGQRHHAPLPHQRRLPPGGGRRRRPSPTGTPTSPPSSWPRGRTQPSTPNASSGSATTTTPPRPTPSPAATSTSWTTTTNPGSGTTTRATTTAWWPSRAPTTPPTCSISTKTSRPAAPSSRRSLPTLLRPRV